jgi:DNA-binding SARP family transcriptional activator
MLALRLCGDVQLSREGKPVEPPLGAKTLGLLAFLALEPGAHRREELATLLWGDSPEEKARASLRQALTHLREALGDALRVDRATVELAERIECDVLSFLERPAENAGAAPAIDVARFLESLPIRNCRPFEEWAEARRAGLVARCHTLLGTASRDALARRDWQEAIQLAERWSRLDPLLDDPVAVQIEARFLSGDRAGALAVHARHLTRLEAEGIAPGRALTALAARIERSPARSPARRATETWYEHAPSFDASLVGRAREWEALKRAWDAVVADGSRVVLVEGEPGAGKTRLSEDFLRWVTSRGGVVLRGRGYDARAGAPYGAMIETLRGTLDAPGLAGVDAEWLAEVSRVLPELRRHFAGLPDPGTSAQPADGWRLFEAVAQVLLALAEESPLAVLIDDLQWCDADSCALLHFLVRRLGDAKVLWCATYTLGEVERDAPAARLARALRAGRGSTAIALTPLSADDVWQVVRELGRVDAPEGGRRLAARIHEVTAGNPFYVIELLKTLFAQELLTVDPETRAWIVAPTTGGATPATYAPTVHEAIADRIECLPDEVHALLITIACAGRGCRADVLSHVHGISRRRAAMLGDALVDRHLVIEEEGVYRCSHPTIAAVVRTRLTTSRRREVHRALAQALELLLVARGEGGAEAGEIASHADHAGDRPMAYRYALLASQSASARCAYDEALSWLDLAASAATSDEERETVDRTTARVLDAAGWREAPPVRARVSLTMKRVEQDDLDLPLRA